MAIKVGISGFGRISRLAIRTAMDMPDIEIAGINYRNADLDYLVYMLKYSLHKQVTNVPTSFAVARTLDFALLEQALRTEILRNDCLRIVFK